MDKKVEKDDDLRLAPLHMANDVSKLIAMAGGIPHSSGAALTDGPLEYEVAFYYEGVAYRMFMTLGMQPSEEEMRRSAERYYADPTTTKRSEAVDAALRQEKRRQMSLRVQTIEKEDADDGSK